MFGKWLYMYPVASKYCGILARSCNICGILFSTDRIETPMPMVLNSDSTTDEHENIDQWVVDCGRNHPVVWSNKWHLLGLPEMCCCWPLSYSSQVRCCCHLQTPRQFGMLALQLEATGSDVADRTSYRSKCNGKRELTMTVIAVL